MGRKDRKKGKNKHSKRRHTPLSKLRKRGSKLESAFSQLPGGPMHTVHWERDLLPEHLWLGALAESVGFDRVMGAFYTLMDAIDSAWPHADETPIGLLSDFGEIAPEARPRFIRDHRELIEAFFLKPFGRMLAFYPENPAAWLVTPEWLERGGPLDPAVELPKLRAIVDKLLEGKDSHTGHLRALPFGRLLKHGRVTIKGDLPVAQLLPKYPKRCTEDERYHVESAARSMTNMHILGAKRFAHNSWAKYFWRHNHDLTVCRPFEMPIPESRMLTQEEADALPPMLLDNAARARRYLQQIALKLRYDLYAPERGEILFGLFARLTRLYTIMCEDLTLWARDLGGIMLRCITDTAITFAFLATHGTDEDFDRFREYGEGQEKLLMLHLQDNHPDRRSIEGRTAEDIASGSDGFGAEMIDIELGTWHKRDARQLARACGMEHWYRLVFSPASSDIHGTWMSLKNSNFARCADALHRYHRIPTFIEPPPYLDILRVAQDVFSHCAEIAVDKLGYLAMAEPLCAIPETLPEAEIDAEAHADGEDITEQ